MIGSYYNYWSVHQQLNQQRSNALMGMDSQQQYGAAVGLMFPGHTNGFVDYAQPTTHTPKKLSFIQHLQKETDEWLKGVMNLW